MDADLFKEVNDVYGHAAGDELLGEMTRRIQSAIRMSDVLVRWGGEEFLVVSRYTERSEATTLASRILHMIGSEPFQLKNAGDIDAKNLLGGMGCISLVLRRAGRGRLRGSGGTRGPGSLCG